MVQHLSFLLIARLKICFHASQSVSTEKVNTSASMEDTAEQTLFSFMASSCQK